MQVLKEGVKEQVITAAIQAFIANGYQATSMRSIAHKAGITVGNIYRYFKGKEDLLAYILEPLHKDMQNALDGMQLEQVTTDKQFLHNVVEKIVWLCKKHSSRFNILFNCVPETQYRTFRNDILQHLLSQVTKTMAMQINSPKEREMHEAICGAVARSIMEGIAGIVDNYYNKPEDLKTLLTIYISIMLKNMDQRLGEVY